jgi:crotonobetainyl-CoA:carnitine CoA-transferase CaiB-like acyl-CoA transferase
MMLADLGADVIKVEKNGTGDDTHDFAPVMVTDKGKESGYFAYMNRNKRSFSVNMKDPDGVELVKELAKWADVFVENFSPGVVGRLGIGYEDIKKINPGIIYCSISGFGQYGPYMKKPAYDVVCQAMGGYMGITGEKDGKPFKLGTSIVDAGAGIHAAFGIMAALYYREKTGEGQFLDVGMMDVAFSTLENFVVVKTLTGTAPTRDGNANLGSAPFNCFLAKDGYVTIACANNNLFKKLCTVMDRMDLLENPLYLENSLRKKNEKLLNKEVEAWTLTHTVKEVVAICDEAAIPSGPILSIDELVEDPHLKARDMLVEIDNPILGKVVYPGNPLKFSETSDLRFDSAPVLGQHNDQILKDILGKSDAEISALKAKNIF